jgi:hypothetical protein
MRSREERDRRRRDRGGGRCWSGCLGVALDCLGHRSLWCLCLDCVFGGWPWASQPRFGQPRPWHLCFWCPYLWCPYLWCLSLSPLSLRHERPGLRRGRLDAAFKGLAPCRHGCGVVACGGLHGSGRRGRGCWRVRRRGHALGSFGSGSRRRVPRCDVGYVARRAWRSGGGIGVCINQCGRYRARFCGDRDHARRRCHGRRWGLLRRSRAGCGQEGHHGDWPGGGWIKGLPWGGCRFRGRAGFNRGRCRRSGKAHRLFLRRRRGCAGQGAAQSLRGRGSERRHGDQRHPIGKRRRRAG